MKDIKKYLYTEELTRYKEDKERVIYCDMDSVLVDFEGGLVSYFNTLLSEELHIPHILKEANITDLEFNRYIALIQRIKDKLGRNSIIADDLRPKYKGTKGKPYTKEWYEEDDILAFATYRLVYNNYNFWKNLKWTSYGKDLLNIIFGMQQTTNNLIVNILSTPMLKMGVGHGCYLGKQKWVYQNIKESYMGIEVILEKEKERYATPTSILIDDSASNCEKFKKAGGKCIRVDTNKFDLSDFVVNLRELLL